MNDALDGKVAVVAGGSSGTGLAIARRFVDEGALVFITGRRQEELDAAGAELGPMAVPVQCDPRSMADLDRLYEVVHERAGRIDVLVANAGGGVPALLREITEKQFDAMFATNVKGVVFAIRKAMPLLSQGASVILIGLSTPERPDRDQGIQGAAQAAIRHFSRTWALDAKQNGFRVNVLTPGSARPSDLPDPATAAQRHIVVDAVDSAQLAGRIDGSDGLTAAVLFLASDAAEGVNGVQWFTDGGSTEL